MKRPKIDPKGSMLVYIVEFEFRDSWEYDSRVLVRFCHDPKGKPDVISVFTKQKREKWSDVFVIDNRNRRYKPCATHAAEIVQRLKASKPELRVFA